MKKIPVARIPDKDSEPPSWFVWNGRNPAYWCAVTTCTACGLTAHRDDNHPANPCPRCGGKLAEEVGRWVGEAFRWWHRLLYTYPRRGHWLVKTNEQ